MQEKKYSLLTRKSSWHKVGKEEKAYVVKMPFYLLIKVYWFDNDIRVMTSLMQIPRLKKRASQCTMVGLSTRPPFLIIFNFF